VLFCISEIRRIVIVAILPLPFSCWLTPVVPEKRAVKLVFVVVVVVDFLFQTPVFVSFVNFDNYLAAVIEIAKKIK